MVCTAVFNEEQYPSFFYSIHVSGQLDIPPYVITIVQIVLTKHVLHMFLFCNDDGMVDDYHEYSQQNNYRIKGVKTGRSDRCIHASVHRVPAQPEQSISLEAGIFSGGPETKGIPHFESPEIQESEPGYPEKQRSELEGSGYFDKGYADAPALHDHGSPEDKD